MQSNPSQRIHRVSADAEDEFVTLNHNDVSNGELHRPNLSRDEKDRILFCPQVTVNVFGNRGPSSNGTDAEASGADGDTKVGTRSASTNADTISDLEGKVAALSRKVEELSASVFTPKLRIENGIWNTSEVHSWESPQLRTEGYVRFGRAFNNVPRVIVSMQAVDVSNRANFRVSVYTTDVSSTGFKVHADSWDTTVLYSCGVTWIAVGE